MALETLREAERLFTNIQELKALYDSLPKTKGYTVCLEFSLAAKESLYLKEPTDIVVYTFGLGKLETKELAFCIGPGVNDSPIAVADAVVLAGDVAKVLDFDRAYDIAKDFKNESYTHSVLLGGSTRQRHYEEVHSGKSALEIHERTLFKKKHMTAINRETYPWEFDVHLMMPMGWVS